MVANYFVFAEGSLLDLRTINNIFVDEYFFKIETINENDELQTCKFMKDYQVHSYFDTGAVFIPLNREDHQRLSELIMYMHDEINGLQGGKRSRKRAKNRRN